MARVALDAMGGDHAPAETVAGAVAAAARGVDVVLVGDHAALTAELAPHGVDMPIVHAAQIIAMGDNPARAIRDMPDSSIVRSAKMVKSGEADALVSAGSTGAALAAAAIVIGRIPGVLRPAIASIFPTPGSHTVVLDSGA
ncbi:MAG: phosphate--acyl-ACP acyltransferase, partial [Acidimicrobiia bacterium]|nr:phosphate--acyl-ACP acyltransferase [Acidimicrobiia bacterium]